MSKLEIEMSYPLRWPADRPRSTKRKRAAFSSQGRSMTMTSARQRLFQQVSLMTRHGQPWRTTDVILSTNIRYTASGGRDQNVSRRDPDDPGVALYFRLDRRDYVLACDRWDSVQDNIAAIAAHVDALRGQERWGVADLRQAFAGHVALPPPAPWWEILSLSADADLPSIHRAYRELSRSAHPDVAGDRSGWDRLVSAYEAAKAARS